MDHHLVRACVLCDGVLILQVRVPVLGWWIEVGPEDCFSPSGGRCLVGDPKDKEEPVPGTSQAGKAARAKLAKKSPGLVCSANRKASVSSVDEERPGQDLEVFESGGSPGCLSTDHTWSGSISASSVWVPMECYAERHRAGLER